MFEIPSDLPLKLGSLAWLLGHWQGWGTVAAAENNAPTRDAQEPDLPESAPFTAVLQDIVAEVVGEQMRMTVTVYSGDLDVEFDPLWTSDQGLDHIQPGDLLFEETTYWSVDTPLAVVPASPDESRELRVVGSDTRGYATLWAGVAMGPRIQLASDAVARAPRAELFDHFSRMFGLVGGELMWAGEAMPPGGDFDVEITGRLRRGATPAEEMAVERDSVAADTADREDKEPNRDE